MVHTINRLTPFEIKQLLQSLELTQEMLASDLKVSQSQISRVVSGKSIKQSKLYDSLCIYLQNKAKGISLETVKNNTVILGAIASIWDGTDEQAQSLSLAIRGLKSLCLRNEAK